MTSVIRDPTELKAFKKTTTANVYKELPKLLGEPLIYLSARQRAVCRKHSKLKSIADHLPGWVSQAVVASAFGKSKRGIRTALAITGNKAWVWATEFENVHTTWKYPEQRITVDGTSFPDSEFYYHSCKPTPFDNEKWLSMRYQVMDQAVKAKLQSSKEVRELLIQTHPHPLISIKDDEYWGVHPVYGGMNALAEIYEKHRKNLVNCL